MKFDPPADTLHGKRVHEMSKLMADKRSGCAFHPFSKHKDVLNL